MHISLTFFLFVLGMGKPRSVVGNKKKQGSLNFQEALIEYGTGKLRFRGRVSVGTVIFGIK